MDTICPKFSLKSRKTSLLNLLSSLEMFGCFDEMIMCILLSDSLSEHEKDNLIKDIIFRNHPVSKAQC